MDVALVEDIGVELRVTPMHRKKPQTKDPNAESFWAEYDNVFEVCRLKASNPKWGAKRISDNCPAISFRKAKTVLEGYFFDDAENNIFRKSQDNESTHRRCVRKQELIERIKEDHAIDHRKADTIYESMRHTLFPVVRETVKVLFKTEVKCQQCACAAELPATSRSRRPIPATYPNSRWQVDLKKMPACKGSNYVINIVDCYSRFGFGKALKGKTAKEVAETIVHFIYLYGAPRILQSDNGREFKNADLVEVVKCFDTIQMHGRPYHPQSQGRVERFNRTMTEFFRRTMVETSDWVASLPRFYYTYNNRVNKSTRPSTPYQIYFRRPNFAASMHEQVPIACLTAEERAFLQEAHLDVESENEAEDPDEESVPVETSIVHINTVNESDIHEQSPATGVVDEYNLTTMSSPTSSPALSMPELSPAVPPRDVQEYLQRDVSSYYMEMYERQFGGKENEPPQKKPRHSVLLRDVYPLEQFGNVTQTSETTFYPNVGERIYYRLNPALAAGTSYFKSGFFKPGKCVGFESGNGGRVYVVKDEDTGHVHRVNRYQLKQA